MGNKILAGLANLKRPLIKKHFISKNTLKASSFTQYRWITLEKKYKKTIQKKSNAIRNNKMPQFDGDIIDFRIKKQHKQ